MFYRDYQKAELLKLFKQILPEQEWQRLSENANALSLEDMKAAARNNLERVVSAKLLELGIQPHMLGYGYLRVIICDAAQKPDILQDITHNCYIKTAKAFDKTPISVERAIRLAISNAWETEGELSRLIKTSYRPTNREFISLVAEHIRMKYL